MLCATTFVGYRKAADLDHRHRMSETLCIGFKLKLVPTTPRGAGENFKHGRCSGLQGLAEILSVHQPCEEYRAG